MKNNSGCTWIKFSSLAVVVVGLQLFLCTGAFTGISGIWCAFGGCACMQFFRFLDFGIMGTLELMSGILSAVAICFYGYRIGIMAGFVMHAGAMGLGVLCSWL